MSGLKASMQQRRDAVAELKKLIPGKPEWPKSNVQLAAMLAKIEYLKKTKQVLAQMKRQWERRLNEFRIQHSFSGRDRFITFTPGSPKFNRFRAEDLLKIITTVLPSVLARQPAIKVVVTYNIDMHLATNPKRQQVTDLNSKTQIVYSTTDLEDVAYNAYNDISRSVDKFTSAESGWAISRINHIQISTHEFQMSSGGYYVVLPDKILATKSCINVKNRDNKCVMWELLSALFPADKNADRVSKYEQYQHRLDLTGIDFPTPVKQIQQIQRQNPALFPWGINVFSLDDSLKPIPLHIAPESKPCTDNSVVNLLWWNNHYCWIKNFSRFARSSITAHHGKMYFCYSCLSGFTDQQKLIEHNKYCYENTAMITPDPAKNILCFRKPQREIKTPFIIYGDFESFIVPVRSHGNPGIFRRKSTNRVQKHIPASYCLNTVCVDDKYSKLSPVYRVEHVDDLPPEVHMLKYLFAEQARIQKILDTGDQFTSINSYKSAVKCYICRKPFSQDFHDKVPFVDVFTRNSSSFPKYIGAVHESCRQFQKFIPVVFHNLRGYDGHLILRALGHPEIVKYCADNKIKINCIPSNSERLLSLTIGKLRFIDSIQFMNSSLDNLGRNCNNLRNTRKYFPEQFCQEKVFKGIFPYEAFTGPWIFSETSLPPMEAFYSSLYDSNITAEQYQQAWNNFQCNNFGDYHDAYLQLDVFLLSDVCEEFRVTSMTQYGLDPAHYFSAPGLSWDAALKHSQVQLELLTDPDMYLFIEHSTRGGISIITKKYSRANNKYLHDYNVEEPSQYICYLDVNNLYGAAMSMPLPYGGFKWISSEEFLAATNNATAAMDSSVSYFVEVDVDYPAYLHDSHNDYPYLPEHLIISDDMLSREQLALRTNNGCPYHKLVPSLFNKRDYICHYSLLKQALHAGLILRKVHRVLQFNHSCWLKTYIDANTTRRNAAKSDFEKDFFKLMNNSVFGKTMENVRKRVSVDVVNNVARRNKLVRGNCFQHEKRISESLVLITKKQKTLKLNKPIYVGAAVLDLSKTIMYDFHYGFFRKQFPRSTLLMSDTDSLVYEVHVEDLYQDIFDNRELFDLSDVQEKFHDNTNKKVIGKFKDEFAFRPVREFCGLRSKMYSLITEDDVTVKKAKGVNNNYDKNKLTFGDYLTALTRTPGCKLPTVTTREFRSYRHEVVTDEIAKVGLNNYDDKRFTRDGINTTALGHDRNFDKSLTTLIVNMLPWKCLLNDWTNLGTDDLT